MIEQIKEVLEMLSESDRTGASKIMVPVSEVRYLIGEVERLQHERDNALSLRNISVKHYNTVKEENDMLRRELAEYREEEEPGPRFKMDAQGNLTLIVEE